MWRPFQLTESRINHYFFQTVDALSVKRYTRRWSPFFLRPGLLELHGLLPNLEDTPMVKHNPNCGCGEQGICNEVELSGSPCCRCVPRRLCVTFTSDDPCACDGIATQLELDENQEYVGAIVCGDEYADLLIYIEYSDETCYWRVVSEYLQIDSSDEISSTGKSCEEPSLSVNAIFEECAGTISVERYDLERLPPRVTDCVEEPWCGGCDCICSTLCLARDNGYSVEVVELEWDADTRSWGNGEVTLERDETTGDCVAITAGFDPIPVEGCGVGLSFFARNEMDQSVSGKCKTCSCNALCVHGCCFPILYNPYFGWYPEVIPFSISAPDCPEADGFTSEFAPLLSNDKTRGACGVCGQYPTLDTVLIQGQAHYVDEHDDTCKTTPCGIKLCFAIACDEDASVSDPADCCGRVRLILGVSEIYDGTHGPLPVPLSGCFYFMKIAPSSCSCDEEGGISAIFPLDALTFVCKEFFSSGPCLGYPKCCTPVTCSFSGATLVI